MKSIFTFVLFFLFAKISFSQFGKDGVLNINSTNNIVNEYAILSSDALALQNNVVVTNISDLNVNSSLTCGDLILIYQAQGATIDNTNTNQYGNILGYGNAGLYELHHVMSVSGNTITTDIALINSYFISGHTQVVKVPQYSTLNINSLGSVTTPTWNGSKGGIVVIHSLDSIIINGKINSTGKGFRAGICRTSGYVYTGTQYVSSNITIGGEKGEGIAGNTSDYDLIGGRYCRGAPANGGGGGTNHNAGGGGGANASNGNVYNGAGVMCSTCTGSAAWSLDADYISNSSLTNSSGGGKGGNTYANSNQNALVVSPGTSSWSGDSWRNVGGRGGRPLTNINASARIYFGGGGGAADANDNSGGSGANGGGLIILISPKIKGAGQIIANGDSAQNSYNIHADALGGGGGGGSIILNCNTVDNTLNINAIGGKGGSMISIGAGYVIGSGAGGGGGYISYPIGSNPIINIGGGLNGKNYHAWISEFPANGATIGGAGLFQSSPVFTLVTNYTATSTSTVSISSVSSNSICAGESVTITPAGSSGYSITPGNNSGNTFTVNPTTTTTYTISGLNSCSPSHTTITINVSSPPPLSTSNQTICSGQTATLTANGATSYTWSVNNTAANSVTVSPTATSVYTVIGSNGTSCTSNQTVTINVVNTPTLTINNPAICSGETVTLTVNGATNYIWSSTGSISNPTTTTQIVSPTITTTYSVTGTNAACSSQTIATVSVTPSSTIAVTGNTFVCPGQSTTLTANGTTTYTWNTGANSSTISVSPTTNTTYTISGTTGSCTSQTLITVNTTPNITVSSNTAICSGQTATLTANGASTYTWTDPSSLSGSSGNTVIASPNSTTNYTVTGTMNTCTTAAVISVTVNFTPTITAVSFTNTSCGLSNGFSTITSLPSTNTFSWSSGIASTTNTAANLAPGIYTVTAINGACQTPTLVTILSSSALLITTSTVIPSDCASQNGSISVTDNHVNSSYSWSPSISSTSNSINNLASGNYSLTITNGPCTTSATFYVGVIGGPTGLNLITNNTLCQNTNGSIHITNVINGIAPYQYNLNNSGFASTSTYSNLTQGNYTITVKDNTGCTYTQTLSIKDTTINATIDLLTNTPTCSDNDGSFIINTITGGTSPYLISFNNTIYSTDTIFEHLSSGTYTLNIRDSNNCETGLILSMPKNSGDYTLYIPNSFTPNNNKINDIWYVMGTCLGTFHCYIYNRWGEMIRELNDIKEGWDGTYKGSPVPDGVYVYLIEVEVTNQVINKAGHITLFR